MELNDRSVSNTRQGMKAGRKGYSWYSRLNNTKRILLWLMAMLVILAIALGVGLGVGLRDQSEDEDD